MKQQQLTILALALLAAGSSQAQTPSSLSVYGILDVGVVAIDGASDKTRRFVSSGSQVGSRLGLRGTEEISPGWKAMFTFEHQLYADTGSQKQQDPVSGFVIPARALVGVPNTIRTQLEPALGAALKSAVQDSVPFWNRQAFVGLITPAGAVLAGRQYSPAFATFGRFDPHLAGNVGNALATLTVPTGIEIRIDNSLQYVAELGGFRFNAMVGAGEGAVGAAKFWGFSAGYASGPFDVQIAHQRRKTSEGLDSLENTVLGASYQWGNFKFTGMYLTAKDKHPTLGAQLRAQLNANTTIPTALKPAFLAFGSQIANNLGFDGELAYGGVHYQINERNKLVVSYGSYTDAVAEREAAIAGIALEHSLSKRTSIWLSGGYVDNKTGQQILPYAQGLLYGFTDKPGRDASALSLNLVHRF